MAQRSSADARLGSPNVQLTLIGIGAATNVTTNKIPSPSIRRGSHPRTAQTATKVERACWVGADPLPSRLSGRQCRRDHCEHCGGIFQELLLGVGIVLQLVVIEDRAFPAVCMPLRAVWQGLVEEHIRLEWPRI